MFTEADAGLRSLTAFDLAYRPIRRTGGAPILRKCQVPAEVGSYFEGGLSKSGLPLSMVRTVRSFTVLSSDDLPAANLASVRSPKILRSIHLLSHRAFPLLRPPSLSCSIRTQGIAKLVEHVNRIDREPSLAELLGAYVSEFDIVGLPEFPGIRRILVVRSRSPWHALIIGAGTFISHLFCTPVLKQRQCCGRRFNTSYLDQPNETPEAAFGWPLH